MGSQVIEVSETTVEHGLLRRLLVHTPIPLRLLVSACRLCPIVLLALFCVPLSSGVVGGWPGWPFAIARTLCFLDCTVLKILRVFVSSIVYFSWFISIGHKHRTRSRKRNNLLIYAVGILSGER